MADEHKTTAPCPAGGECPDCDACAMSGCPRLRETTNDAAIRKFFDRGCSVSDLARMNIFTVSEIVSARAAWASERAAQIGKVVDGKR